MPGRSKWLNWPQEEFLEQYSVMEVSGVRQQMAFAGLRAAQTAQLNVLQAVSSGLENVKAVQAVASAPVPPGSGKLLDIKV